MASPMFTFRSFTANMVNMWADAIRRNGLFGEGGKFVAKSIGATAVLGGLTALPMYATLQALWQAITGDDDDWTEVIRRNLPKNNMLRDVVCYGVPAMGGVNVGGSLQMETPFTNALRKGATVKEVLTESMGAIIGIPYSLGVEMPSRVAEAKKAGNTSRVVEEMMPTFIKNGMQAWRLYTEGQTTMKGRPINIPGEPGARKLTAGEAAGKFLGFQPLSNTKSYAAYSADKWRDEIRSDKKNEFVIPLLNQLDGKDPDGRKKSMEMVKEWNEKMRREEKPNMIIPYEEVTRLAKSRRRQNKATPKQREKGSRQRDAWGL